jgi:hypothetical protein
MAASKIGAGGVVHESCNTMRKDASACRGQKGLDWLAGSAGRRQRSQGSGGAGRAVVGLEPEADISEAVIAESVVSE